MLKSREQAANRAAGIGDEQGRMPSRVKAVEVMIKCTQCSTEIRATKKNIEAMTHVTSRHPSCTFSTCCPGAFDPTAPVVEAPVDASAAAAAPVAPKKKAAAANDLSFLDSALNTKEFKKK